MSIIRNLTRSEFVELSLLLTKSGLIFEADFDVPTGRYRIELTGGY